MKIAVLSGKGGTGKTLLSVNLAAAAESSTYIDCDVEEPNGLLFFKPQVLETEDIAVKVPSAKGRICIGCRICVDFCKFNALAHVNGRLKVFENICHSCGGCLLLCPEHILTEKDKVIGKVLRGIADNVAVHTGVLNIGEPSGIPIIKRMLSNSELVHTDPIFIDCPPGSACTVMESIKEADYCILVAEPTLFGVHNLNMVYELVKLFGKPHGAVLNKCLETVNPSEIFCEDKNISILGKLPFDRELATLNSNALIAARVSAKYRALFSSLLRIVKREAAL
jgi:MinD superfamily P-loop ATPase